MKIPTIHLSVLQKPAYRYAIIALLVVAALYVMFGSSGSDERKVLTITPETFIQTISVSGKVIPAKEVNLGFTSSGRIGSVSARVGSTVSQGTVLASLDAGDLRAQVLQREAALENQRARLAALEQGSRPEEIAVAETAVRNAEIALEQANDVVIDAIRNAYVTSDDAIRVKLYQFISNPRTSTPQVNFPSSNSQAVFDVQNGIVSAESLLQSWLADNARLSATGDMEVEVRTAQQRLSQISSLLSRASVVLTTAIPNPTVTQTVLDAYTADIAGARTSVSTANTSLSASVTAQKNAVASLETARRNLSLKQAGTLPADIDAQRAQIRAAEADLASAQAQLSKALIVAPFTGVITSVDAKVGSIASPNTALVSMISVGTFQIESYVPEVNVGLVAVGNSAEVTLDAYGEKDVFKARVISIDPAATVRDGVPAYRALLQFQSADNRIKSGMTANVVITTAEKENVISVPQGVLVERTGRTYVKVLEGETTVEREVTTGAISSLGNAEILSGLSEGEIIILSEAAAE